MVCNLHELQIDVPILRFLSTSAKSLTDKPQNYRQCRPPIGPAMAAVTYPEFVLDPFLPHDLVHLHVSVQQTGVITAINVITDFWQVVLIPVGEDFQNIVLLPMFVSRSEQAVE